MFGTSFLVLVRLSCSMQLLWIGLGFLMVCSGQCCSRLTPCSLDSFFKPRNPCGTTSYLTCFSTKRRSISTETLCGSGQIRQAATDTHGGGHVDPQQVVARSPDRRGRRRSRTWCMKYHTPSSEFFHRHIVFDAFVLSQ